MSASGRSRRAWGWHRLADEWAARVVAAAGVRPSELVFDLGAGEGALTAHIVRAFKDIAATFKDAAHAAAAEAGRALG